MRNERDVDIGSQQRCGHCEACKHVAATKNIIMASSAKYVLGPSGKLAIRGGLAETDRQLWNNTLRDNPCERQPNG